MSVVTIVLWLALQATRYERAAEGIALPSEEAQRPWREKGPQHERVVELVMDRQNWVEGLKRIDARLGLFAEAPEVAVTLEEWEGTQAALGGGSNGKGNIKFNMKTLAAYQSRIEEYEELTKKGAVKVYVPPTQIKRTIWHEMTHVLQDKLESPAWFREGMACAVEHNDSVIRWFAYNDHAVDSLQKEPPDEDVYARGWLFWLWLEQEAGAAGLKQVARATCVDGADWKVAVEAAVEKRWPEILEAEQAWSREHVKELRRSMGLK